MSIFALILAAGVVLRFDDAHPVAQWRELAAAFDAEGQKASFAVPMGYVKTEAQRAFLREAAANGHEIMDHAYNHGVFFHVCRDADEFDRTRNLPCVAECDPSTRFVGFRFDFDRAHPGNRAFRGTITNGVLVVSREEAKRLHRPNKVFVPSRNRHFGFYDSPDGHIRLRSFYRPEAVQGVDVPEGELLLCDHRAYRVCEGALRHQAELSRSAFRGCGLPEPKAWIQPGGWEPWVPADLFRKVYANEFGYTAADCIPGSDRSWNGDPKAPDPEIARYTFRPIPYFDNASVTQDGIRRQILAAQKSGRGLCFLSHMQPSPKMKGGWGEWLDETRSLLAWLKANKIPVRTLSEMADCLWGPKEDVK